MYRGCIWIACLVSLAGCAKNRSHPAIMVQDPPAVTTPSQVDPTGPVPPAASGQAELVRDKSAVDQIQAKTEIDQVHFSEVSDEIETEESIQQPSQNGVPASDSNAPLADPNDALTLDAVIASVYQSYPLLQGALYSRNVALGEQIAASGEFDLKLKGASESGPVGFYQTYRQSVGVIQPLVQGGEVFAGYRVGRGEFQPWYLERQTNDGGEFKAGVSVPLLQNVDIDARRAALWNAQYGRQLAEPEIQAQLIQFVQEASYAYWGWVAAGESYRVAKRVLELAEERTSRIESQVNADLIDPPELTDNLRLVAERKGKLADARRKVDQSAAKLSLYFRDSAGHPLILRMEDLPAFPDPVTSFADLNPSVIQLALQQRPELKVLGLQRRQYEVEYAQAENLTLPRLDGVIAGAQDVGAPTSSKRDKSPFELEAGLYLDVPIQRRKARGKLTALEGKLSQIAAKQRMVSDKIAVDVRYAWIALDAALVQVAQAREAVRLAEDLAGRERQNLDAGLSDLLKVTLREQYAAESAQKRVDALLLYYQAQADFRAALGQDSLTQ